MGDSIFKVFMDYWQIFLKGLRGTLLYAFIAVFFGTILGAFVAMAHMSRKKAVSGIAAAYVNVLRGTPLLVQMYISYYFVPIAIPALNKIDKVYFVVMALILNSSAYVSEIIRSGIQSVDIGQTEAARSLGMTSAHCMRKIVLPQAVKNILPALGNEYITMIKETSLAGTMMLYELTFTKTLLANKYLFWQPLIIIAIIYLVVTLGLSWIFRKIEKRMSVSD